MNSAVAKQYLMLADKPILYYSLKAFQESDIDEILLVVGAGEEDYVNESIVKAYSFSKVIKVVAGGQERFHSVNEGLNAIDMTDYVLVHDGARPFITIDKIHSMMEEVVELRACILGVPSKDTIKIVNEHGYVIDTPKRKQVWNVQTPQAFSYSLLSEAYEKLMISGIHDVTDDAMVVELMTSHSVRIILGSYDNIKITTPEDLAVAGDILKRLEMDKSSC
jgi:2-C-methyl-D-erythritol 4-phosphate cytidylyltransferase